MPTDAVVEKMKEKHLALTVCNYITLAFWNGKTCLEELEGEDRVYVEELVEEGILVETPSNELN